MSRLLSVFLVDDEPLARRRLRVLLAAHPEVEIVGEAGSLGEARRLLALQPVDLVLLDIDLFGEDGFDLLPALAPTTRVTFVTAHNAFAIRAFECHALDYLLKPIEPARLASSLARLHPSAENTAEDDEARFLAERIPLRDRGRIFLVPKREIIAIFAEREYTRVITESFPPLLLRKTMQRWEEELTSPTFLRIHRHTLINLAHLTALEEDPSGHLLATLHSIPEKIPVSTRLAGRLKAFFSTSC